MIDYTYAKRPAATVAGPVSNLPRLADGRISYSHPDRPALGTVVLGAGESVTLNANGGRTITDAAGNSRTVFARKQ